MSGDRSRERRQRACECLAMAKRASDANSRAFLVETAWKWLDLAERDRWDNWEKALRLRAIQTNIGRELRAHYELPQQLPHGILARLIQINAPQDEESGAGTGNGQRTTQNRRFLITKHDKSVLRPWRT
jgi:hypothetical protein